MTLCSSHEELCHEGARHCAATVLTVSCCKVEVHNIHNVNRPLPENYCGSIVTNSGCFHLRAALPELNQQRFSQYAQMRCFETDTMIDFPAVCKCKICSCCQKTYTHPFQLRHRFPKCPGKPNAAGVLQHCKCNCESNPPPPLGTFPSPFCSAYEKALYRIQNPALSATSYLTTSPCPAGSIPYYLL